MLKAGTAKRDVSPTKSMFLWGYPHVARMSTGIHDPLFATALYLDDGQRRTLAVAVDVLYVDKPLADESRRRIQERIAVSPEHVMISATHTHSGPVTCSLLAMSGDPVVPEPDPSYREQVIQGIVEAACQAAETSVPAEVAITSAQVDGVGCNRLSPEAARDPEAGIVAVRRAGDKSLLAVQLFYSMHPTVLHEDSTRVSSDFPAYTRQAIQQAFPGVEVVYHNGPCGNLSPRYHVKAQTFAEAERLGARLGGFVVEALSALRDEQFASAASVGGACSFVSLPVRRFSSVAAAEVDLDAARETYERLKREGAGHGAVRTAECVVFGAEEVVTLAKAQADGRLRSVQLSHQRAEVQVFWVGDTFLVALPGEYFVEYALEIKRRASARAFVMSMANGELQGYITTPEAVGYEANLSLFTPDAGAVLVEEALKLILKKEITK
jgi:hypothetical protein